MMCAIIGGCSWLLKGFEMDAFKVSQDLLNFFNEIEALTVDLAYAGQKTGQTLPATAGMVGGRVSSVRMRLSITVLPQPPPPELRRQLPTFTTQPTQKQKLGDLRMTATIFATGL